MKDRPQFDVAVLANCLWYFSTPSLIRETIATLSLCAKRICIAEWSLSSSLEGAEGAKAYAHILSTLTQGSLAQPESNIRTIVSPIQIKKLVSESHHSVPDSVELVVAEEGLYTPPYELQDGRWETYGALSDKLLGAAEKLPLEDPARTIFTALRDTTETSVANAGGVKGVRCMDVWWANFVPKTA